MDHYENSIKNEAKAREPHETESEKEIQNTNKSFITSTEKILKENLSCEMFQFILNIFYSPHLAIKFFFSLFTLTGFGLASYMIINLILIYTEFNVITTIRTLNENPVAFPKVTICNINPFTTQYAYEFLLGSNFINITQLVEASNENRNKANIFLTLFRASLLGKMFGLSDEQKKNFGHNLTDSLLSCIFNMEPCTSQDFQWEWDSTYGNCFSFNSGINSLGQQVNLSESFIASNTFGLQIEFYVNFYEELMFFNSLLYDYGLLIRIDNVSHVIHYLNGGIFIPHGSTTFIALNRQFKTSLPKPYSDCDDLTKTSFNSILFNLIDQSVYEYTQKFCLEQCLQELFVHVCNCSYLDLANLRNTGFCSNAAQLECCYQSYNNIYFKNNYIQNTCLSQCPLECNSFGISYKLSSSTLLPNVYKSLLQKNVNLKVDFINRSLDDESVVLESVVKLNIFYDTLSYTSFEESPQMDIVSLLGSIGGNLGLFMGVCLFSFGEVFVALIEIVLVKISTCKKKIILIHNKDYSGR